MGISTSLKSGLPRRDSWVNGPEQKFLRPSQLRRSWPFDGWPWSTRRSPRPGWYRVGMAAVGGELFDRNLDGDAVYVDTCGRIDPLGHLTETGVGQAERVVVLFEGSQITKVEDGAEVHVEALGSLAGEDLVPPATVAIGLIGQTHVIGS